MTEVYLFSSQVTFLPLLNEPCSFDLLIYTNKTAVVPKKWEDSDPRYIMNSQEVKLRSFTTSVSGAYLQNEFSLDYNSLNLVPDLFVQFHQVDSMVTYKEADEWEL